MAKNISWSRGIALLGASMQNLATQMRADGIEITSRQLDLIKRERTTPKHDIGTEIIKRVRAKRAQCDQWLAMVEEATEDGE